jgi:hypothetical protein
LVRLHARSVAQQWIKSEASSSGPNGPENPPSSQRKQLKND